ncbi:hypothetical protein Efla_006701 [Eimeria flavescens]
MGDPTCSSMSCNPECELNDVRGLSTCVASSLSAVAGQPLKQRKTGASLTKEIWSLGSPNEMGLVTPSVTGALASTPVREMRKSRLNSCESQWKKGGRLLKEAQGEAAERHRWREKVTQASAPSGVVRRLSRIEGNEREKVAGIGLATIVRKPPLPRS